MKETTKKKPLHRFGTWFIQWYIRHYYQHPPPSCWARYGYHWPYRVRYSPQKRRAGEIVTRILMLLGSSVLWIWGLGELINGAEIGIGAIVFGAAVMCYVVFWVLRPGKTEFK